MKRYKDRTLMSMVEDGNGEWVMYEDVEELEDKLKRLKHINDHMMEMNESLLKQICHN